MRLGQVGLRQGGVVESTHRVVFTEDTVNTTNSYSSSVWDVFFLWAHLSALKPQTLRLRWGLRLAQTTLTKANIREQLDLAGGLRQTGRDGGAGHQPLQTDRESACEDTSYNTPSCYFLCPRFNMPLQVCHNRAGLQYLEGCFYKMCAFGRGNCSFNG